MRGFVYFLQGGGFVKIGKTTRRPSERVADFSPKLPFKTEIVHVIECVDVNLAEVAIHECFKSLRTRGEWFDIDEPDLEYIKSGAYDSVGQLTAIEADALYRRYGE
jgi:hypothetical protein